MAKMIHCSLQLHLDQRLGASMTLMWVLRWMGVFAVVTCHTLRFLFRFTHPMLFSKRSNNLNTGNPNNTSRIQSQSQTRTYSTQINRTWTRNWTKCREVEWTKVWEAEWTKACNRVAAFSRMIWGWASKNKEIIDKCNELFFRKDGILNFLIFNEL